MAGAVGLGIRLTPNPSPWLVSNVTEAGPAGPSVCSLKEKSSVPILGEWSSLLYRQDPP